MYPSLTFRKPGALQNTLPKLRKRKGKGGLVSRELRLVERRAQDKAKGLAEARTCGSLQARSRNVDLTFVF